MYDYDIDGVLDPHFADVLRRLYNVERGEPKELPGALRNFRDTFVDPLTNQPYPAEDVVGMYQVARKLFDPSTGRLIPESAGIQYDQNEGLWGRVMEPMQRSYLMKLGLMEFEDLAQGTALDLGAIATGDLKFVDERGRAGGFRSAQDVEDEAQNLAIAQHVQEQLRQVQNPHGDGGAADSQSATNLTREANADALSSMSRFLGIRDEVDEDAGSRPYPIAGGAYSIVSRGYQAVDRAQFQTPDGKWHDLFSYKGNLSRDVNLFDEEERRRIALTVENDFRAIIRANYQREGIRTDTGTLLSSIENAKVDVTRVQSGRPSEGNPSFVIQLELADEMRPSRGGSDPPVSTQFYGPRVFYGRIAVRPVVASRLVFKDNRTGKWVSVKRTNASRAYDIFRLTDDQIDKLAIKLRDSFVEAMYQKGIPTQYGLLPGPRDA